MPNRAETVVTKPERLTEDEFHSRLMVEWSRMIAKFTPGRFALKAGVCTKQLTNIKNGAIPHALTIFNLLAEDDDALRDILAGYGLRVVPSDAVCTSDAGTLPLAALLHQVAQAEHPESHGGTAITEHEARIISEEDLLAVQRLCTRLIEMKRKPLRAVR